MGNTRRSTRASPQLSPRRRMTPTSLLNSSQQPHQHDERSKSHDQLDDLHDGEEVSTPSDCPPGLSTNTVLNPPIWERLVCSPPATCERISLITTIFSSRDEVGMVRRLRGGDAQACIDMMYEVLDDLDHASRMSCLRLLCKICGQNALLPKSLDISVSYDRTGIPPYRGSFADVWKGVSQDRKVAVKELKLYQSSDQEKIRKGFCKEVVMWSRLRHPNMLPLLGATMIGAQYVMVSGWMMNGNINEFLKALPDADRLGLLRDVGRGLEYLHGQELVHGDLKGANVLINHDGHACIADFSLLMIIPDKANLISAISYLEGGTVRWTSPELLDPEPFGLKDSCQTKESDCYALGMVIYEVLTGQIPFSQYKDTVVIRKVMEGERPERPKGTGALWFTDDLWGMLEFSWKSQPHDRPSLKTLLRCLEGVIPPSPLHPPAPTMNEDTVTSTNNLLGSAVTNLGPSPISSKASGPKKLKTGDLNLDKPPLPSPEHTVTPPAPRTMRSTPPSTSHPDPPPMPFLEMLETLLSFPAKPPTVARTSKVGAVPHHPICGEAAIREFANSDLELKLLMRRAGPLLSSEELLQDVQRLTPEEQTKFVDKVNEAYPIVNSRNAKYLTALGMVCSATEKLPPSAVLSVGLEKRNNCAAASGGMTNLWQGYYCGRQAAIKVIRTYPTQDLKEAKKILWKRVPVWRKLFHDNILPFHRVNMTFFELALVYDWGPKGNVNQYIALHPGASRPSLLFDVVKGSRYLHSLDITHGNLKGANIVVDQRGRARLTEYGLVPIYADHRFAIAATPGVVGCSRWLAPEIINPPRKGNRSRVESEPADVFAFAMVAVEVFTGELPFGEVRHETAILMICRGCRPEKPENAQAVGLTGEMWKVLESCWQQNSKKRPTMEVVVRGWGKFIEHDDDVVTEKQQLTNTRRTQFSPPSLYAERPKRRKKWFCGLF